MTRRLVGAVVACLALLAGLWLVLAPFALGGQPSGTDWTDQTVTDVWSGIGLAVIGLIAAVALIAALIRNLAERGLVTPRAPRRRVPVASPPPGAEGAGPDNPARESSDLDKLLAPLVAALAHDLERDRDGENGVEFAHVRSNNHVHNNQAVPEQHPNQAGAESPRYSEMPPSEQSREMPR